MTVTLTSTPPPPLPDPLPAATSPRERGRLIAIAVAIPAIVVLILGVIAFANAANAPRQSAVAAYETAAAANDGAVQDSRDALSTLTSKVAAASTGYTQLMDLSLGMTAEVIGDQTKIDAFQLAMQALAPTADLVAEEHGAAPVSPKPSDNIDLSTADVAAIDDATIALKKSTRELEEETALTAAHTARVNEAYEEAVKTYSAMAEAMRDAGAKIVVDKADATARTTFTAALAAIAKTEDLFVVQLVQDYITARAAVVTSQATALAAEKAAAEKAAAEKAAAEDHQNGAEYDDGGSWDDGGGSWDNSGSWDNGGGYTPPAGGSTPPGSGSTSPGDGNTTPDPPASAWAPLKVSATGMACQYDGSVSATYGSTLVIPFDAEDYWTWEIPGYGWGAEWVCFSEW